MGTNASNPDSYASVDEALDYYDARLWGDLCGDVGVRYTAVQMKDGTNPAGQRFQALLKAASFDIESACIRGGRYSSDDLASLEGVSRAGLVALICDRAIVRGMRARNPLQETTSLHKETSETLNRLRLGEDVFGVQEDIDAGAGMETALRPDQQPGPRPALSTFADRYFGERSSRLPATGCRRFRGC